ncbi:MAG: hypothetical protein ABFD82_15635 [Syntrophaceae bacterium]
MAWAMINKAFDNDLVSGDTIRFSRKSKSCSSLMPMRERGFFQIQNFIGSWMHFLPTRSRLLPLDIMRGRERRKSIKDIRRALTRAYRDAGIPYGRRTKNGFVFHDNHHCFNTNMRKSGVPESLIMKITGHSTRECFSDMTQLMTVMHGRLLTNLKAF